MLDGIVHLWHSLPWFIEFPLGVLFNVVIVRGIIGNEIMAEINDRGWFQRGWLKRFYERQVAIADHYKDQHRSESVLDCSVARCTVFNG